MVVTSSQGTFKKMVSPKVKVHPGSGTMFRYAVAETQGHRPSYEDAYATTFAGQTAAFWVFDGHRGDAAAKFAAEVFPQELGRASDELPSDQRIQNAFQAVDQKLRSHLRNPNKGRDNCAGSTVVGAFATRNEGDGTYSAKLCNCGDSRGVVIRAPDEKQTSAAHVYIRLPESLDSIRDAQNANWDKDASWLPEWPAVVETIDHKPSLWAERVRIEAAGGTVCGGRCARLDGNLAVSRGIGDFDFKCDLERSPAEQKVSCVPDIYEVKGLAPGSLTCASATIFEIPAL
ncbi:unnamed protein product [Polarella glacialis]|uniref:protein-serine/threonine phosphatase n=1 Tax=Polarella glacialis TaxID=89957 RepID=A0A813JLL5_POLGL|nr:unnamed protein product [Polarella glacialis]